MSVFLFWQQDLNPRPGDYHAHVLLLRHFGLSFCEVNKRYSSGHYIRVIFGRLEYTLSLKTSLITHHMLCAKLFSKKFPILWLFTNYVHEVKI